MRAREFITESQDWRSHYDTIDEYQGILMGMTVLDWEVEVFALTRDGKEMGSVIFDRDGKTLIADGLMVHPEYQGQGIATDMYDYTKSKGFKIIASPDQTDDGAAFWKKHRGNQTVWEDEVDEMALPADWDPSALGHDKTFKSRLDYAKQKAPRLGGGSSRVAFIIPDQGRETVLKVAKNTKGMAQNEAELEVLDDGYLGKLDIVIPLVDYDRENPTPTWIQTEKASKVSQTKLAKMLHAKGRWPMTSFLYAIENVLGNRKKNSYMPDLETIKKEMIEAGATEQDLDTFFDYVNQVADLVNSSNLLAGDFGNAANWGEYQGRPVIIDLGYSKSVHELYWGR